MNYYLSPTEWRQDEYRDVMTKNELLQSVENIIAGSCDDVIGDDLIDDAEILSASNMRDAIREAHKVDPGNLNPEARFGYGKYKHPAY